MRKALWALIIAAALLGACDYEVHGVTVFRGWIGRITDALHAAHGGGPHDGRGRRNE